MLQSSLELANQVQHSQQCVQNWIFRQTKFMLMNLNPKQIKKQTITAKLRITTSYLRSWYQGNPIGRNLTTKLTDSFQYVSHINESPIFINKMSLQLKIQRKTLGSNSIMKRTDRNSTYQDILFNMKDLLQKNENIVDYRISTINSIQKGL